MGKRIQSMRDEYAAKKREKYGDTPPPKRLWRAVVMLIMMLFALAIALLIAFAPSH